jgi:hypothetical protein
VKKEAKLDPKAANRITANSTSKAAIAKVSLPKSATPKASTLKTAPKDERGTPTKGSAGVVAKTNYLAKLFDPNICREPGCDLPATSGGYCRLHYIKNWKKIKRKEIILREGKLSQFIDELVMKYPLKYIDVIRLDLGDDREFSKVIYDLELDESIDEFDADGEGGEPIAESFSKRDFEEDSDF